MVSARSSRWREVPRKVAWPQHQLCVPGSSPAAGPSDQRGPAASTEQATRSRGCVLDDHLPECRGTPARQACRTAASEPQVGDTALQSCGKGVRGINISKRASMPERCASVSTPGTFEVAEQSAQASPTATPTRFSQRTGCRRATMRPSRAGWRAQGGLRRGACW